MSLHLADNALGPCVTGKDEGDPGRDGEPGSPIWPAKTLGPLVLVDWPKMTYSKQSYSCLSSSLTSSW